MQQDPPAIDWNDELSAFDHMMYRADSDQRSRTTMMTVETLDVVPDWDRLRAHVDRASRQVLRLRQKVVAPLVPVTAPRWVLDPDFNLDYHLRRIQLPGEAGLRELLDYAEKVFETPLDLGRPLWEWTLIEGLAMPEAKAAIISKLSHTVTDGIGGQLLERFMRQDERDPELGPMPPIPAPEDLSMIDLTKSGVKGLPGTLVRSTVRRAGGLVGDVGHAIRHPGETLGGAVSTVQAVARIAAPSGPDPSPVLARRSTNRRFDTLHFPLASLRLPAKAHGCSVNDAYLAAIAGALGRYHEAKGVPVDAIPLAIPVDARPTDGSSTVSNQWSAAQLSVPLRIKDPVARMRHIREDVLDAVSDPAMKLVNMVAPLATWIPGPLLSAVQASQRLGLDVQASNVPGHPYPRYIAGARLTRSIPFGPVPGAAMMITMLSMDGNCDVGVNYDTASIDDQELFHTCLEDGFEEIFSIPIPDDVETTSTNGNKSTGKKSTAKKSGTKATA